MLRQLINWVRFHVFKQVIGGLIDEIDARNFRSDRLVGEVTEADLHNYTFHTFWPELFHQGSTDFCVGFSKKYFKTKSEGKEMSGAGAFAMGCRAQGYVPDWGISILQVMKGAQKYGVPTEKSWPITLGRNYAADWRNMPDSVVNEAYRHRDESFFQVIEPAGWDRFDTFRAYLHKLKDKHIVIQTGCDAHAVTLIGQEMHNGELCLVGPDSYGYSSRKYRIGSSVDGFRYFNRAEANQLYTGYIAFDMPRELAELLQTYDGKAVKTDDSNDCYLVKDGQRHLLKNEAIAWAHNTLLFSDKYVSTITPEELNLIPMGNNANFRDGQNWEIVQRILEKTGRFDLLNAD